MYKGEEIHQRNTEVTTKKGGGWGVAISNNDRKVNKILSPPGPLINVSSYKSEINTYIVLNSNYKLVPQCMGYQSFPDRHLWFFQCHLVAYKLSCVSLWVWAGTSLRQITRNSIPWWLRAHTLEASCLCSCILLVLPKKEVFYWHMTQIQKCEQVVTVQLDELSQNEHVPHLQIKKPPSWSPFVHLLAITPKVTTIMTSTIIFILPISEPCSIVIRGAGQGSFIQRYIYEIHPYCV
jgi:hypothetical protein